MTGGDIITEAIKDEGIFNNLQKQLYSLGFRFDNDKHKLKYLKRKNKDDIVILLFTNISIDIKLKEYLRVGAAKLPLDTDILIILNHKTNNKIQVIWKEENSANYVTAFINYKTGDIKVSFDFDLNYNLVTNPEGKPILEKNNIKIYQDLEHLFIRYDDMYIKSIIEYQKKYEDGDISIRSVNGFRVYLPKNKKEGYFNSMKMNKLEK